MEYDPKDNEVIHLLKKLKESNGAYPPAMLASRRQGYLRQVAQVASGAGLAAGIRSLAKGTKGTAGLPPAAGTLIEALLVVAIVVEAGAVTYFYRDQLAEYFRSITNSPKVEQVASPPVQPSLIPEIEFTSTPVVTVSVTVSETGTLTLTPEGTPSPELAAEATKQGTGSGSTSRTGNSGGSTGSQSVSTQDPNSNNGNQYGLTPKPVRTKEPGNDISSSTQGNSTVPATPKKKP